MALTINSYDAEKDVTIISVEIIDSEASVGGFAKGFTLKGEFKGKGTFEQKEEIKSALLDAANRVMSGSSDQGPPKLVSPNQDKLTNEKCLTT